MRDVLALDAHMARAQFQHPEDRLHRGGFARPVGADDDRDLALVHGKRAAMQDVGGPVAAGHRVADEEGFGRHMYFQ